MGALAGIRILEVSQFEVGTVCGQQLAWLGADVIKVERPDGGELGRRNPKSFFATLNSSKRGITIDLKSVRGIEVFLKLVQTADVVVENLSPGKFEQLGLSYDRLSEANPRIIFARAKGFGTWGPLSSYKSFDMVAQAMSGAMAATGTPGDPPLIERFPVADNATGIHLALGILAALWQRQQTGRGQQVETSLQDTMLSMGRMWFSFHVEGVALQRTGNHYWVGGDLYPCSGASKYDYVYLMLHPNRWTMWTALLTAIGRDDLADRSELADPEQRLKVEKEIDNSLRSWLLRRDKHEALRELGAAGVPIGAVLSAEEVIADPHLRDRGMIVDVEHPTHGKITILGSPIKLSESPANISPPPLDLGADTDQVLAEAGLSQHEIDRLHHDSVL